MNFTPDMQIIELDSFDTAFPVQPGKEGAVRRRFMTLFASGEQAQVGGTSYVCKAQSFTGETFALKRLLTASMLPADAKLTPEDSARITKGHAAAFYEEYKNQLLVSRMRGFPKLYGYGMIGDDPVIVMEWVEGVSLRALAREADETGKPLSALAIAQIGASVLDVLESAGRLDSTLVHRDISPANIMIRTTSATIDAQAERGSYDVCLIDFGSATADEAQGSSFTMVSQVWRNGTPEYAAPEMLTQDVPHVDELRKSQAIDVFALCSVLYELYAGHTPWRVGDHPEVSPFRLKTENPPEPIQPRNPGDEPLVEAIMRGLAIEQSGRPSVRELLGVLQGFIVEQGGSIGDEAHAASAGDTASASPSIAAQALPAGLYTPDSTHLKVADAADGGRRAGEDIPAFKRSRGISRRQFIAGGLAFAAFAIIGGGLAARSCAPQAGFDFSGYPLAETAWAGEPLYPAMQLSESTWHLLDANDNARVPLATDREPGRFCKGLIKAHDAASGGYGYLTAMRDATSGNMSSAWAILPTFANAGDFSETDGLAPVQDPKSGMWGYIDEFANAMIPPSYEEAGRFSNGYAAVRPQGSMLWGLRTASGAEALEARFMKLGLCSSEGLLAAAEQSTSQWGFVDLEGKWVIPDIYRSVRRFTNGLAACLMNPEKALWGYIDTAGKEAIPARFAAAYPFSGEYAPAKDPDTQLWGLIDTSGAWHVEPRYLSLGEKTGDLFPAHGSPANAYDVEDDKTGAWAAYWAKGNGDPFMAYGYIDADGNWVFKPSYGDTLIRQPEQ